MCRCPHGFTGFGLGRPTGWLLWLCRSGWGTERRGVKEDDGFLLSQYVYALITGLGVVHFGPLHVQADLRSSIRKKVNFKNERKNARSGTARH